MSANANLHAHDDSRVIRPVSAPVRRSKTTTYPSVLRDRVNQTIATAVSTGVLPAAIDCENDDIIFERPASGTKSYPPTARDGTGYAVDTGELGHIKALLEEEVNHVCAATILCPA